MEVFHRRGRSRWSKAINLFEDEPCQGLLLLRAIGEFGHKVGLELANNEGGPIRRYRIEERITPEINKGFIELDHVDF